MNIKFNKNYVVEIDQKIIQLGLKEYTILKYLYENIGQKIQGYVLADLFRDTKVTYLNRVIIPRINKKCGNIILETRVGNCYYIEK